MLILLYKGLKGNASLPTVDNTLLARSGRNHHSVASQTPTAGIYFYKGNFFPQTIRDWNALPESVISPAEVADDSVSGES